MRLRFLVANQAWAFVMGDALVRLHRDEQTAFPLLFQREEKQRAVDAAADCGLRVDPETGEVTVWRSDS